MKNKSVLIILLVCVIALLCGFIVYDKFIKNSSIEDSSDKTFHLTVNDIYTKISNVKDDQTLTNSQKAADILNFIEKVIDDKENRNYKCVNSCPSDYISPFNSECFEICTYPYYNPDGSLSEENVYVDKNLELIDYGYGIGYVQIINGNIVNNNYSASSIDGYINYRIFNRYSDILKEKLAIDSLYSEEIESKYGLNANNLCVGYKNEENYFYININQVDTPKMGWYYFNKFTGECSSVVKVAAQYKIDKSTNNYEIIEK